MIEKIGRNDPCVCGSGKKYKNCCMQKQQSKPAGLSGRKFTAKVLSSGHDIKSVQQAQDSQQLKSVVDYNLLMERSFGDALKGGEKELPPTPSSSSQYLVEEKDS